ncbi:MAG: hypothetical protein HRT80_07925 [Henriciella sp.]|nr:hypothetical protein [Henriciella sp.]
MARKRYSDEDVLRLLREIELSLAEGLDVESACRKAGVSDAGYTWRSSLIYTPAKLSGGRCIRGCTHLWC